MCFFLVFLANLALTFDTHAVTTTTKHVWSDTGWNLQ